MTDADKLKLLQRVSNEVVDGCSDLLGDPSKAQKAVKALQIVLVAMGVRNKPVMQTTTQSEISQPQASSEA